MAFIVKKKINGNEYYYLNENKRVNGKVKTKTLAYLGKNREEAEKKVKEMGNRTTEPKDVLTGINQKLDLGNKIEGINKIASTKGFFFPTASIYGSSSGFYTYGHLGKALKTNWENLWRKNILSLGENFHEIQSNNILPEKVFIASGHVEKFNDPMTECKKCHTRFRADQLLENIVEKADSLPVDQMTFLIKEKKIKCSHCGASDFSEVKQFNMMFSLNVGLDQKAYLSPETAQGVYIHFLEEFKATREKLPLGLAIIDKAYRNEISPRQMVFRLREFTQAELQIFFDSEKINEHEKWDEVKNYSLLVNLSNSKEIKEIKVEELNNKNKIPKFYLFHAAKVQQFYLNVLKIPKEKFRFRELSDKERAFYNKIHFDIEVNFDTLNGFKEIAGIHYRGDHDLSRHQKASGKNMDVFYDGKKILPHVLELSFGVDRNVWMLMDLFYDIGKEGGMFKFPARLSPIKAAIIPIVKKDEFEKIGQEIYTELKEELNVTYDSTGSVGRRYARADEIGTNYCITIDGNSIKGKDVTVRLRDTTEQVRVKISNLKETLTKLIEGEIEFEKAGKIVK